jgi:hypothetical protein
MHWPSAVVVAPAAPHCVVQACVVPPASTQSVQQRQCWSAAQALTWEQQLAFVHEVQAESLE